MGWVKDALKELSKNNKCQVRPQGGSMKGRIESGQLVTIQRIEPEQIVINDIVFVKWKDNYLLHLIKDIQNENILIGNNLGKLNGWIPANNIIGKVIKVEN
ncbi:hypothetical protein [Pontimicrobium sp. MEBiC06410]|jgi:hypothetical protein